MVRMATEEARREPTPRGYHIAKRVAAQVSVASECVLNKKTYGLIPWCYQARHEITPCAYPIRKSNPTARCLQQ
jgi:hypothetical protein